MAILKSKQVKALSSQDAHKKIQELRLELLKDTKPGQGASIKTREIKRTIAKLLTHLNIHANMTETKKVSPHAKNKNK